MRFSQMEDQVRETVCALQVGDFNSVNLALDSMFVLTNNREARAIVIREGGVEATLSLLVTIKPNISGLQVEFLEIVLGILWNLLQDFDAGEAVVDTDVAQNISKDCSSRLLLAILKAFPSSNRLVFLTCKIMAAIMVYEPNAAVVARLDGGLTTIVNIVHPRRDNKSFEAAAIEAGVIEEVERTPEAIEAALDLLAAFTAESETNVATLSKMGGFVKISAIITDAMAFPTILRASFNVLLSCTRIDKYSSIIGRSTPIIAFGMNILKKYGAARHQSVKLCVLSVLANLTSSSSNVNVMFTSKGTDVIMATMKRAGTSDDVVRMCCVVLWKLFMHSQPPPFNLHEYDRCSLPYIPPEEDIDKLSSGALEHLRKAGSDPTDPRGKNSRGTVRKGELGLSAKKQRKAAKAGESISAAAASELEQPLVSAVGEAIKPAENAVNVGGMVKSAARDPVQEPSKEQLEQSRETNLSAALLTTGGDTSSSTRAMDELLSGVADVTVDSKSAAGEGAGSSNMASAAMDYARYYPELAGVPFEVPAEASESSNNAAPVEDKQDTEAKDTASQAVPDKLWEKNRKLRRLVNQQYMDAISDDFKLVCPTKSFAVDHYALPTASSRRPPIEQEDLLAPVVTDEFQLRVQVKHVERIVNRGKVLNRVVYDANKMEPLVPIAVGKTRDGEVTPADARRQARTRDMMRLGKLCDKAIAGQLRVAGTGKAAAAIAAARSAAAKSVGMTVNGKLLDEENNGPSILRFDGVPPLLFESRFECGNLYKAVQATETEYDLVIAPDINNGSHTQWYYFSVFGMVPGVRYKFNFINLEKPDSMYNYGMKPLVFSERDEEDGKCGWSRKGEDICYFQNFFKRRADNKGLPYYTFTFTYVHHRPDDRVYFSYCFPYTFTNVLDHLTSLAACERAGHVSRSILCRTMAGNPVPLLTVTNFNSSADEIRNRRYAIISARVHPGETPASFMMESIIDFLTGPSDEAVWLRDRMVFKIVPMLNVDGVIMGNHRCNLAGHDLNRQHSNPSISQSPSIYYLKQMIAKLSASSRDVLLFCDLHAHSRSKNIFIYGCENPRGLSERIIPYMLSVASPSFDFESCNFAVKKSKANCGRVVVWRSFGLVNSYTMEASFCSSEYGPRRHVHFKPSCYENLGRCFCETIGKAINSNQSHVLEAAAALESRFSSKACRGYGYSQIRPATKAVGASGSATKGKSGGDGFRSILVTSLPRTGKGAVSAKSGRKGGMKKKRRKKGSSKAGTSKMLNLNI
jgi:hypothetical protein